MKISIYHKHRRLATAYTAAEAVKAIREVLETQEVEPKELEAAIISGPAELAEADFALTIIKTELAALAEQFAVAA